MRKRPGASLMNVMVFMMFTVMITSQLFFFGKMTADSVAEEREIMMYGMNLDSLVDEAKSALRTGGIVHDTKLDTTPLKFSEFYDGTMLTGYPKTTGSYTITIHDLDYSFDSTGFIRSTWTNGGYGTTNMNKKPFAPMLPLGVVQMEHIITSDDSFDQVKRDTVGKPIIDTIYNRFFLIRVLAAFPENYNGRKLMYQALVSRDERNHNVDTLSFQEVWY